MHFRQRVRGLSLLEILLASFMFVTVMVSLMDVWVAHARAFDKSQGQEVASFLAQQLMEQELTLGYDSCTGTNPVATGTFPVVRTMRGEVQTSVFNYTINSTLASPGSPGTENLLTVGAPYGPPYYAIVQVFVSWSDSTGNHTISMECNGGW